MSNIRHLFLAFYVFLLLPLLCSATIANCANTTDSGTTCLTCNPGYQLANSATQCTKINCSAMTNCSLCDSTTTCLTCNYGYSLNGAKTACTKIACVDNQYPTNTNTAMIDLVLNLGSPQRPCPLVQPLPSFVPKPTKRPAKL